MRTQMDRLETYDRLLKECTELVSDLTGSKVSTQKAKTRLATLTLAVDLLELLDDIEKRLNVNAQIDPTVGKGRNRRRS